MGTQNNPIFACLVFAFSFQVEDQQHLFALIHAYDAPTGMLQRKDKDLGLIRVVQDLEKMRNLFLFNQSSEEPTLSQCLRVLINIMLLTLLMWTCFYVYRRCIHIYSHNYMKYIQILATQTVFNYLKMFRECCMVYAFSGMSDISIAMHYLCYCQPHHNVARVFTCGLFV